MLKYYSISWYEGASCTATSLPSLTSASKCPTCASTMPGCAQKMHIADDWFSPAKQIKYKLINLMRCKKVVSLQPEKTVVNIG